MRANLLLLAITGIFAISLSFKTYHDPKSKTLFMPIMKPYDP